MSDLRRLLCGSGLGAGVGCLVVWVLVAGMAGAQGVGTLQVTSGLGRKLYALPDNDAVAAARKRLAGDKENVALVVALSQAEAGRRQYREAVATDTAGLAAHPRNADLLLERGHRELGLREFEAARKDLAEAAAVSPGMLDAHYHLGLAHYFLRHFGEAAVEFGRARDLAGAAPMPEDSLIDCTAWLYVSLRRAGKEAEAAEALARITPAVVNTEPHLAFYLRLLHFYQGKMGAEEARAARPKGAEDVEGELSFDTTSYGVGNWYLYEGKDRAKAKEMFAEVVKGEAWNAWGFVGSEVELAGRR